jgi:hypothetical protein
MRKLLITCIILFNVIPVIAFSIGLVRGHTRHNERMDTTLKLVTDITVQYHDVLIPNVKDFDSFEDFKLANDEYLLLMDNVSRVRSKVEHTDEPWGVVMADKILTKELLLPMGERLAYLGEGSSREDLILTYQYLAALKARLIWGNVPASYLTSSL